jgi:polysaccharide pyruvyl transferase CsaB
VRNIGDDAILRAVIKDLRALRKDIKILVLSRKPEDTAAIYKVDSINRLNIIKVLNAMRKCTLFISGGGTLIQDVTSTRSLIYYLSMISLAKLMDLRVMFYANGIGPLNKNSNKNLSAAVINKVDVITLREELSKSVLQSLDITKPKVVVTADPALTIQPASDNEIDSLLREEGFDDLNGPFAGFSVRRWRNIDKYIDMVAQAADYMMDRYGVKPVFIPLQYPNDITVIEQIISKMKCKSYVIRNRSGNIGEAQVAGVIKRMDMLIGMRLHSLIFAASMGIPVIGLSYDPKVEGFLQYINQCQASAGSIETLTFERLKGMIDCTWNSRDEISRQLNLVMTDLKEKAVRNANIAVDLIAGK